MRAFERFKKLIAAVILAAFVPAQAWGQGITIPAGSTLNLNTGNLTVPGAVTNAGTLTQTTGTVHLTGNWANSGTFTAGTGTVDFSGTSGTQTVDSGGTTAADAFYNLTHSTAGTVQMTSHDMLVNNNFTNTPAGAGNFNANSLNMTVDGTWDSTPNAAFTSGNGTVTLGGNSQTVTGTTTFYNFSKTYSSGGPFTLTFDSAGTQSFTGSLTMSGTAANPMLIRSSTNNTQANIALTLGRPQTISNVDVKDSNAGVNGVQETLVARGTSVNSNNNTNWLFGNITITWTGTNSTEWNDPLNWNPSLVPAAGDTVIIPSVANEPDLCPVGHSFACGAVNVGNLTINASASLTLTGQNLTVTSAFTNNGNVILQGGETLTLTMDSTHGTFTYIGDGDATQDSKTLTINGSNNVSYNNLVINDANATASHRDIFALSGAMTVNGNLTVTSGTLDASTATNTIADSGTMTISANGILKAPSSTGATAFTVGGNWTNNGTFTAGNGLVTLNGTDQTVSGTTTFYQFNKTVAAAHTLTFDHTGTQTFTNKLTLQGASGQLLSIRSDLNGTQANIALQAGGLQVLNFLDVKDSNASGGLLLVPNNSVDSGHNTNWLFAATTVTWTGTTNTDWSTPTNWDLGFVPRAIDTAIIANAANQPVLSSAVTVNNLTLNSGSTLTLSGKNLTVSSTFTNSGNVILQGIETLAFAQDTNAADHGTFTYVGDGSGNPITIKHFGATDYYNLTINDTHGAGAVDTYTISTNPLTTLGTVTVSASSLDLTNGGAVSVGGVSIAGGATLKGPTGTGNTAFTDSGNWSNSGTYTNNGGKVTLNGSNQSITGSTTFAYLRKVVASADTLTFGHTGTQTVQTDLTLTGAVNPNRLNLVSDLPGTQANLFLLAGGTQTLSNLGVTDSNAGTPPGDVTLVDRNDFNNGGHNTNWQFGNLTLTWTGTTNTDWNTPTNWNFGVVPVAGDTVIIANAANQPKLTTAVTVGNLTINSGSTLTLNGQNLTVTTTFANNGNVNLNGNEVLTLTMDSTHGTFTYVGDGDGVQDTKTFAINGSNNVAYNNLVINDPNGTPANRDIFALSGNMTVNGAITVTSGTLDASTATDTIADSGGVTIGAAGTLKAPASTSATAFTVAGNWSNSGTFTNSNGAVTFTTNNTATVTGNTTFYNFVSTTAGKTIQFAAGSNQTIDHTFNVDGVRGNLVSLVSATPGTAWNITFPNGTQSAGELAVQDSNALTNTITCLNCTNNGNNNANWIFATLLINSPADGTTVGQTPTVLGLGLANSTVYVRDSSNNLVATTKADASGNFRVVVGKDDASTGLAITAQLALGANSLTPYLTPAIINPGLVNAVTVVASPTTAQVPVMTSLNNHPIVNPSATQYITGSAPLIKGQGAVGQAVTGQALDANGNLILTASLGTVDTNGNYSVTWPSGTPLPSATNYLSITVGSSANETTSALIQVSLTDPFGYVFNSTTNQVVQGAVVTLIDAGTNHAAGGTVQSCNLAGTCCDMTGTCCTSGTCTTGNPPGNPFTTGSDGFYSFLAPPGNYYMTVTAGGYTYPSKKSTQPEGRSIAAGSKGETFTVGSTVFQLDQPVDSNATLLHIIKTSNKDQGSVGDVITYTINIQNLSTTDPVTDVLLSDFIPPGFKYIKDRVILGGTPIKDPIGPRPVVFDIGTVAAGATDVLQYQLVIGSGVTMGVYRNTANAIQVSDSLYQTVHGSSYSASGADLALGASVISNPASASVRIIPDPVFDLGNVIGKVFFDWNENGIQEAPYYDPVSHETIVEKPVPNVQIVMEDGTTITTDRDGKFNIPGLLPGRHLFRLDERTLPPGSYLTTQKAAIVDVTAGSISKVNFGVNIDQNQLKGRDAVFFNEKIRLTQDTGMPVPRLNAALFNASASAKAGTEEVVLNEGALVRQAEFRIFTNYMPFISAWELDILDADTKKIVRSFTGTPLNINDPIYWNGRDNQDVIIAPERKYSYVLSVTDNKNNTDTTKEKPITVREIKLDVDLKKEKEESKEILKDRADRYRKWLDDQGAANNLDHQLIPIRGETIHLDRQGTDVKSIHVMKGDKLFLDLPLSKQYGLTPDELLAGGFSVAEQKDNLEVILPNGDYSLDVVSAKAPGDTSATPGVAEVVPQSVPVSGGPSPVLSAGPPGALERYSRPLKVGDDYLMFVALGDAKVGYNIDTGNIEPIQDPSLQPGFYHQGKAAYYLKGQILGKYLITSSYDSDRAQKALFRKLDPNVYYPVYGDASTINYADTNTQGALYLLVQWDKSSAILGNYAVDFNDTEFSSFSRAYYGGKIDYQSVANNPYGDPHTKLVVYHAQVQQLPAHNEFLATGGSLYFLKYRNVVQGSDKVVLQVRDATTGLVIASQPMVNGADYELDESQGRILFWQPVAMIAQSESIISNSLVNGNPIYVVIDYQYQVTGLTTQTSQGIRVAQGVGNNLVLGGTYVQDNSGGQNYTLQGTDATLHVTKDATIKAEYAQTRSQDESSYVSTDGGITFAPLLLNSNATGKAYGIKGDARLFDNIGVKTYYKWIGADFGATANSYQQGKEMYGIGFTWDMTPLTRLTASEDIQKLLAGTNIQSQAQVGASETDTTLVQIVHQAEKLKLAGAFQLVETKNVINGVVSTTNTRGATIGGQAQYDLTDWLRLTFGQQVDVMNKDNTATTVGASARLTDQMTLNGQEVFSSQGRAFTAGLTSQLNKRLALTTAYTLTNLNTGEMDRTASVGIEGKATDRITAMGNVAQTSSSTGTTNTTASVGAKAELTKNTSLDVSLGKSQSSTGDQATNASVGLNGTVQVDKDTTITGTTQATTGITSSNPLGAPSTVNTSASTSVGVTATKKLNEQDTTNASVNMARDISGASTTTVGFGNTGKLNQELQAVTENSFTLSGPEKINSSKYGLVRANAGGQKMEADFTRQSGEEPGTITQSNIFGLTGDVNDRLALQASIERGRVQNMTVDQNGQATTGFSQTNRTDITIGAGYVLKDTETAVEKLKNSIKLEYRIDKGIGTDNLHQYVLYDAIEGHITDNWSINGKIDYSKTEDTTNHTVAERHQEIILGMAYRPVNFDSINLIGEYSYQQGFGGGTQQADALNNLSNATIAQVVSLEAVYDINEKWQLAEKAALRVQSERDTGFNFTQTHTWLVVHRLNYKVDKDWTISGEYRDLVQQEAKDYKQGILLEATREINDNTELAIGWNFTSFNDDLTNLSYTSQGPYVRMTGKFYDETPEEKARARARWLDARINGWAWEMIRRELVQKDSQIMQELNRMFALAKHEQKAGHLEASKQIYKDIIAAGQMMYDEASEYIRGRIAFEEQMQKLDKTAREYFKGGEYIKARKIWEKVVEDASKGMIKSTPINVPRPSL